MSDEFLRRLRDLDDACAGRPIPARVQARALERLHEAHTRRRARAWTRQALALGFVAGAALVFALLRAPWTADRARPGATASLAPDASAALPHPTSATPDASSSHPTHDTSATPDASSSHPTHDTSATPDANSSHPTHDTSATPDASSPDAKGPTFGAGRRAPAASVDIHTITLGGLALTSRPCALALEGDAVALPSGCRLAGDGLDLTTLGATRLTGDAGRLRILAGDLAFDIAPRSAAPLAIAVSGGVIEVVGTRFVVHEDGARGHVDLHEGRLRFVDREGAVQLLDPGQRHTWGPSADDRAEEPARPRRRPYARRRAAEALEISRRVTAHRHRGAHAEAARELAAALRAGGWPRTTAEVWSYELGTLHAGALDDRAAACAHWADHARRFADGIYADAVAASVRRLGCDATR